MHACNQKKALQPSDSDWVQTEQGLEKTFTRPSFRDALGFVARIGRLAEEADHHPDVDIRWKKVRLRLITHCSGKVTEKDFEMARKIDEISEASTQQAAEEIFG